MAHKKPIAADTKTQIWTTWIMASLLAITAVTAVQAEETGRSHAGVLVCATAADWDSTISSNKVFECTFSSTNGEVRGKYSASIRDFSTETEKIGSSVLMWQVAGPPEKIGDNYEPGALSGTYTRAEEVSVSDFQLRQDTLVGVGPRSFTLNPVSVQFETGFSVASGVNNLVLNFIGPMTV